MANGCKKLEKMGELLKIDVNIIKILKHPIRIIETNFPVIMDDCRLEIFTGFRVHHNENLPTKGGIRFSPDVTKKKLWL